MNRNTESDLSREERKAMDSLDRELSPPDSLEERVVSALRAEELIGLSATTARRGALRPAWAAVLMAVFLAAGIAAGRWSAPAAASAEADFILILRAGPPEPRGTSDAEILRQVREYSDWARAAARVGSLVAGEKLHDGGRLLDRAEQGASTESMPENPLEGAIEGYFLIRSDSFEEAERLASNCPHLKYGGAIELRRIERFEEDLS
jgi:hypothetical protein